MKTEHLHQVSAVNWFRNEFPDVLMFAIPNGGARHPAVAMNMRQEGVVRGIPDLMIPAWRTFVELKAEKGKLSKEQVERIDYLASVGYTCLVCHGFEDFKQQIGQLKNPAV